MTSVVFLVKDLRVNGANRVILEFASGLSGLGWDVTLALADARWRQWTGERPLRRVDMAASRTERYDVAVSTFYTTIFDLDQTNCSDRWQIFQDNYYRYGQRTQDRLDKIEYSYLHRGSRKIVVSHYLAGLLRAKGIDSNVVHLGVDPKRFRPMPRPSLARPRVLIEGYPRGYKLLDETYEAVPNGWEIWGLGVADHGLGADQMFVMPDQDEINNIYAGCEMFLKLERGGAHPLAPLEAMACGRPTVLSDEGGQLDYSIDEFNSLIAASVEEARECLMRLSIDKDVWNCLARNGVRVPEQFTWPRAVVKLDRLLRSS